MKKISMLTGVALAVLGMIVPPSSAQEIYGCVQSRSGQLRIVDSLTDCRASESGISWNITGPQGPQGPQGPSGSFDPSKIYITGSCAGSFYCQCHEEGDFALSASIGCFDPDEIGSNQVLVYSMRDPDTPERRWTAICKDLDNPGVYPAPSAFTLTCLRP
jgi:hypothetical protein